MGNWGFRTETAWDMFQGGRILYSSTVFTTLHSTFWHWSLYNIVHFFIPLMYLLGATWSWGILLRPLLTPNVPPWCHQYQCTMLIPISIILTIMLSTGASRCLENCAIWTTSIPQNTGFLKGHNNFYRKELYIGIRGHLTILCSNLIFPPLLPWLL